MITLITPTHDRARAFALAEQYVARQTYKGPLQWIVVCDGNPESYRFTMGQEVIARQSGDSPNQSICNNYLAALPLVKGDKIFCWEDDDYYTPEYLAIMADALDQADLVGIAPAFYYHVTFRRWRNLKNHNHASLACTAFTQAVIPAFKQCIEICLYNKNPYIDMVIYPHWRDTMGGKTLLIPQEEKKPVAIGIKGLPYGARGLGLGHTDYHGTKDGSLTKLRQWIGKSDVANYYPEGK